MIFFYITRLLLLLLHSVRNDGSYSLKLHIWIWHLWKGGKKLKILKPWYPEVQINWKHARSMSGPILSHIFLMYRRKIKCYMYLVIQHPYQKEKIMWHLWSFTLQVGFLYLTNMGRLEEVMMKLGFTTGASDEPIVADKSESQWKHVIYIYQFVRWSDCCIPFCIKHCICQRISYSILKYPYPITSLCLGQAHGVRYHVGASGPWPVIEW